MQRILLALAALACTTSVVSAEQLYILLENGCGDRIRYEQAVATQERNDYYAYSFQLGDGSRLMLETGVEGSTLQNYLPVGYIGCNDARLTSSLAERVGNGIDQVYVLRPALNGQYYVHAVTAASTLSRVGGTLTYDSRLTSFRLDEEFAEIGVNITYRNPNAEVTFEGKELGACSGVYLFQQAELDSDHPFIHYRISPEIGLMERRLGSNGVNTSGGVIDIRTINNVPVLSYLATNCENLRRGVRPGSLTGAGQPAADPNTNPVPTTTVAPSSYNSQPADVPPAGTPQPESQRSASAPPAPVTTKTHVVRKGETLYGIGVKYATTPEAIRRTNGMTGNTIYPGQSLSISTTAAPPTTATAPVSQSAPAAPTAYQSSSPGTYSPPAPAPTNSATDNTKLHLVQPGETVASVALKSGYAEWKFRELNGLQTSDVLYVGQQVKMDHCICPTSSPATSGTYNTTDNAMTLPSSGVNRPTVAPHAEPTTTPAEPQPYNTATQPYITEPKPYEPTIGNTPPPAFAPTAPTVQPQPTQQPTQQPTPQTYGTRRAAPVSPSANGTSGTVNPTPARTMTEMESRGTAPANGVYGTPRPGTVSPYGTPISLDPAPAEPTSSAPAPAPNTRAFHIVQEGESLYNIAVKYNTTTEALRELNGLKGGEVPVPFQKLYLN